VSETLPQQGLKVLKIRMVLKAGTAKTNFEARNKRANHNDRKNQTQTILTGRMPLFLSFVFLSFEFV
jgi:hypothetical protein